jgi:membrane protein DedA with SNARE-associated domain
MDPVRFGIYTTIGCIPWTAGLAAAGYAVGSNWNSIVNGFRGPTYIIAAIVVIGLVILAWRYVRRRNAEAASGNGQRPGGPSRPPGAHSKTPGARTPR